MPSNKKRAAARADKEHTIHTNNNKPQTDDVHGCSNGINRVNDASTVSATIRQNIGPA